MNDRTYTCGRCGKLVPDFELCWWCHDYLCYDCWDEVGHCGHPEAEAINVEARKLPTPQRPAET